MDCTVSLFQIIC